MTGPPSPTDRLYPLGRKKRGPFHLVPVDREGDLGEAVIGMAVPGKAIRHHHHPLRLSIPLAN